MEPMANRIIEESVRQWAEWRREDFDINVSINLSASTITDLGLPERLEALSEKEGFELSQLTFEVTETTLMSELGKSLDILTRLRLKNLELSIDDFGTGYSSMVQLHRVPFSELKIDKSFVLDMLENDESKAIVRTMTTLGNELDMRVCAEGVEDRETLETLADLGCDIAQGYFIGRPMPGSNLEEWASTLPFDV